MLRSNMIYQGGDINSTKDMYCTWRCDKMPSPKYL